MPQLADALARCIHDLLDSLECDDVETFNQRLSDRNQLLKELKEMVLAEPSPAPSGGWRRLFAEALQSETRLKARVKEEHERLKGEIQEVGEARTNLGRLAEAYNGSSM